MLTIPVTRHSAYWEWRESRWSYPEAEKWNSFWKTGMPNLGLYILFVLENSGLVFMGKLEAALKKRSVVVVVVPRRTHQACPCWDMYWSKDKHWEMGDKSSL